ncbi:hypothetical protein OsccyDRAFT_1287 [Leptolyngbyaceae cyanobacterium JSC-12]|nr:hypothetical protein OsccyDRAFT_1287 [Leptolyngbyaceae cyanobacterium JSC-12]
MVASVERIEQEIAELHKAVTVLAEEFYQAYSEYLTALGQALRQQVVMSSYHICTQGYPMQFLALSLGQRQTLQQNFRALAKQAQANLIALLCKPGSQKTQVTESETGVSADYPETEPTQAESPVSQSLTPTALAEWQNALETAIAQEFSSVSAKANRLLQQAGVLPKKLPEFLQASTNSQIAEITHSSDMLSLLLEAQANSASADEEEGEGESEEKPRLVVQIVAFHLQLSDVEFGDATATLLRNRLRNLSARLKKIGQLFQKKERELAIAQAQDAWRAAWFED